MTGGQSGRKTERQEATAAERQRGRGQEARAAQGQRGRWREAYLQRADVEPRLLAELRHAGRS